MKRMKKGIAWLLSMGILTGAISMSVQAETRQISTVIEADGTIHTICTYDIGLTENSYYSVNRDDVYRRYDDLDSYVLNITCTDAAAFEEEFSELYNLYQREDGSYFVYEKEYDVPDIHIFMSGMTYDEVDAMRPAFQKSENVQTISIQRGYQYVEAYRFEATEAYWVCSETELSAEDFDWAVEMGYTIQKIETSDLLENTYTVTTINPADVGYWEGIYNFMLHCMDMPTVYAVDDCMIEQAIMRPIFYETVAVYNNAAESAGGDVNADGKVDITDAALILQHYAQHAASSIYAAAETDAMDVNGDGNIDIADATKVLEIYAQSAAGVTAS